MKDYGLLGEHLTHSYSKFIHEAFGFYEYEMKETAQEDLADFMTQRNWKGINVGIPYKQAVLPFCEHKSERVLKIGATNTIKKLPDGTLFADNTDYYGFLYMAKKAGVDFKGKKCVMFGHGGGSLACAAAIEDCGGSVTFVTRRKNAGVGNVTYDDLSPVKDAEIAINTTPVGMYPNTDAQIVDLREFPKLEAVLDIVYNPVNTRIIQQAKELGLKYCSGLSMLVAQAKKSCEIYMDTEIPDERIEEVLAELEKSVLNIIFIGMPGAGKNTIGAKLAQELGLKFAGTDEYIAQTHGKTAGEIITTEGEAAFRKIEAAAAEQLCKEKGCVIACGGGIVKDPENYKRLKQNGIIIWLQRSLDKLATSGRPLSQGPGALEKLWKERSPIYDQFSDYKADNNGTIEETVAKIKEMLKR